MGLKNSYLFKNRDGQTDLSRDEMKGLKLRHISKMHELDEAEALNIIKGLSLIHI